MQTNHLRNCFLLFFTFLFSIHIASAQSETQNAALRTLSKNLDQKYKEDRIVLEKLAKKKGWPLQMKTSNGSIAILTAVYANGLPEYTTTDDNIIAAATIGTNQLWSGGELGLNLDGGSANMVNKLAIWDAGKVRSTHIELDTNRIIFKDGASVLNDHATHVAGTMIAKGINPVAKGMSFNAQNLLAFDFSNDVAEMSAEASGLLVSNHSYGSIAGWRRNTSESNRWEFWGEFGASEDFKFGYYSNIAKLLDSLAFLAPNYLIVKSAGNNRSSIGPAVDSTYWRFDATGVMIDAGPRPAGISSNNAYDIIPTYGTAKNILTVGAVNAISTGYQNISDVVMSSFSSWGPSDDGRIKPDIVANGVRLTSSTGTGDSDYATFSGTSMAAPNASGSIFLLQEHYNKVTNGSFMRSATLRGLIIHTADEAGVTPGPDYQHGWGLLNVKKAASVITGRNTTHRMLENNLVQDSSYTMNVVASGTGPLIATLCWTDPPGTVETINRLNNRTPKLVNDLDLEVSRGTTVSLPWKLNLLDPAAPAIRGDNVLDNVEKIEINNPVPGETYTIKVKHKRTLANNAQAYSLLLSGVGGTTYCTSGPSTANDSRIDNFNFGGINNTPAAGCRQYSNFTDLFASVYLGQTLPLAITLGTCGANKDKMAKVFIDWNGDGNFTGANELVATTGIINGTGTYNTNITVTSTIRPGFSLRIRIVCAETTDANSITSCGTYTGGGETQDYSIVYLKTTIDVIPAALVLPDNATCATDSLHISVRVKNIGSNAVGNFPVTLLIKNGATIVATLTDTVKQNLLSEATAVLNFRTLFNASPGINYLFTVITNLGTDLNKVNDSLHVNRTFLSPSNAILSNIQGQLCSPTEVKLSVNTTGGTVYWYDSPTSTTPIGTGTSLTTGIIAANKTYHIGINDAKGRIGPINKMQLPEGGYNQFTPGVKIQTFAPLLIENARMYFGFSGKITFRVENDATGIQVSSVTLDVIATDPTPQSGASPGNDPNDAGRVMPLYLKIPIPGNYTIRISYENGATIFRNNNISFDPYPFTIPGLMSITGNEASPLSASFYYYFYDMKVKSLGCPKPMPRQTVVAADALTPTISQNGSLLTSSITSGTIQWLLNGAAISGATNPTLIIKEAGTYKVTIAKGGCDFSSSEYFAFVTSLPQLSANELNLIVSNNPGNGSYNVMFQVKKREKILIEITNLAGQLISRNEFIAHASGSVQQKIDIQGKASGIYLMKIFYDNKQYTHKLVLK